MNLVPQADNQNPLCTERFILWHTEPHDLNIDSSFRHPEPEIISIFNCEISSMLTHVIGLTEIIGLDMMSIFVHQLLKAMFSHGYVCQNCNSRLIYSWTIDNDGRNSFWLSQKRLGSCSPASNIFVSAWCKWKQGNSNSYIFITCSPVLFYCGLLQNSHLCGLWFQIEILSSKFQILYAGVSVRSYRWLSARLQ